MTDEEMARDADRALLRYARNEKVIVCLLDRMSRIGKALDVLVTSAGANRASEECQGALEALDGYDVQGDVQRLNAALAEREDSKVAVASHGYGHMVRE